MPTTKKTTATTNTKKSAKATRSATKKTTAKAPEKKRNSKPSAKVAVITRTKDRPILLKRAIESVLNQHFDDWLHVIVNDGGNAKAVDALVEKYQKRYGDRVLVKHNQKSKGMEAASNVGVKACTSEFIVIHDDDDAWHEDFLRETVTAFEATDNGLVGAVLTHAISVHEKIQNEQVEEITRFPFNDWVENVTLWRMAAGNFFPPISLLIHRKAFDKVGGAFREDLPVLGDWEFNLRLLEQYEIAVLPQLLAYYHHRVTDNGERSQYANSIIGGVSKHGLYTARLRNEFLRRDLKRGQTGLGFLMNLAPPVEAMHGRSERLVSKMKEVGRPFQPLVRFKRWLLGNG